MLRTAFYIVDRGTCDEETKEPEGLPVLRNTRDEPWTFAEDLSLAFAKAQSVLHDCYGGRTQETGHKTLGHVCVTDDDRRRATEDRGSLLYGELLPRGVHKALDARHLDAAVRGHFYVSQLDARTRFAARADERHRRVAPAPVALDVLEMEV